MDLFSKTIMGGIIIYFAFVIMFSLSDGSDGGDGFGFFDSLFGSKKTVFLSKDVGTFGTVKSARRIFNLGGESGVNISSGKKQDEIIKEIGEDMEITAMLFSKQGQTIYFERPANFENIFVGFNVDGKYSSMGDLIVKIGNNTIYRSKDKGLVCFTIPEESLNSTGSYNITIIADKSENVFGKTHYIISDLKIIAQKDVFEVFFPIPLEDYEIDGWNEGIIDFIVEEAVRSSPLEIIINNNVVYSQKPLPMEKYEMTFSNLEAKMMPKENIVVFSTKSDSNYILSNVHISVKYYDTDTVTNKKYSFYLSEKDINLMKKNNVKLNFTIDEITMRRPIKIRINEFETQI
ncbi:MAG: hypothetical protein KAI55_04495, partial [Candidatus Aenigmarchaeota archaeon]|nr:hypothetical protein [Candidatus Aenigmarchaeota archaeon]